MSHFEYLMVMVSIILGLGATQALRGLSKLARSHRPFLPVALWGATLFYLNIQVWWGYWDMADVAAWTQPTYYIIVLLPCALFAAIELLMPIGAGAETDWEKHYFSIRPWFFGVLITFQTVATLASYIISDVPLTHPYRIEGQTIPLVFSLGAVVHDQRYQSAAELLDITEETMEQARQAGANRHLIVPAYGSAPMEYMAPYN